MQPFNEFAFEDILRYGVALVIIIAWLIAVLYSVWGGLLLIMSWGKEEKVKPAINHIRHAIIWVIVLLVVLFVAPIFARILWFEYLDVIRPSNIFQTIRELSSQLFGGSTNSSFTDINNSPSLDANFTEL